MKNLTESQIKFLQIFLGLAAGIGIWLSIYFGSQSDNVILQYLFLIIFVVVIFSQRAIERKTGVPLKVFTKFWLIGLIVGLGMYLLIGLGTGKLFN